MVTEYFQVVKHLNVCKPLSSDYIFPGIAMYLRKSVWTRRRTQKLYLPHADSTGDLARSRLWNYRFSPHYSKFFYTTYLRCGFRFYLVLSLHRFSVFRHLKSRSNVARIFLYYQDLNFSKFWTCRKNSKNLFKKVYFISWQNTLNPIQKLGTGLLRSLILLK
jgi:hypothetical protein